MMNRKNKLKSPQYKSGLKIELKGLKSLSKHKNKLRLQKSNQENSVQRNQMISPKTFRLFTNSIKQPINKNIGFKYLLNVWCKNQQIIRQLSQLRIKKGIKFIDIPKQPKQPKNMYILSLLEEFTEMYVLYKKKTKDPHCTWYILTKAVNSNSIEQNFNSIYSPIKFKFISCLNTFFNLVNQKRFNFVSQDLLSNKILRESSIFQKVKKVINLEGIQSSYISIEDMNSIDFLNSQVLQVNCLYLTNWKFLSEFYKKHQKKNFQNIIIFLDQVSSQQIQNLLNKQKFIFIALQNYDSVIQRYNFNEFQKNNLKNLLQKSQNIKQITELNANKIRKINTKIRELQLENIIVIFINLTQQQKERIRNQRIQKRMEYIRIYYFFCNQKPGKKLNIGTNFTFQVSLCSIVDKGKTKNFHQIQIQDNSQTIQETLMKKIQQKLKKLEIYSNKKNILKHVALYNIEESFKNNNKSFIQQFEHLSQLFSYNTKIHSMYEDMKKTKNKINIIFGDLDYQRDRLFNSYFIINKQSQLKTTLNAHLELLSQIESAYSRFFMQRVGQNQITFVNIFQIQDLSKQLQLQDDNFKELKVSQFLECLKEIKQKQSTQKETIFFMIFEMNNFVQDFESQIESLRLNSGAKIQIYLKYGQDFIYRPQNGSYRFIKFTDLKSKINQLVTKLAQQPKISQSFLKVQNQKLNHLNAILPFSKQKSEIQVSTNWIDQTKTQYIPEVDLQNFRQLNQMQSKTVKKSGQTKKHQLFICIHRSLPSHSLQNRSVFPYNLLSYYHPQEAFLLIPFLKSSQFLIIIMKEQNNLMVQKYKQKYHSYQNFKVIQLKHLWQNQVKKQIDIQIQIFNLGAYLPSIQKKIKYTPLIIFEQKSQNQLGSKQQTFQKIKSLTNVSNFESQYHMKLNQKSNIKNKEFLSKSKQYLTSKSQKRLKTSQKSLGKSVTSLDQISFTTIGSKINSFALENQIQLNQDDKSQKSQYLDSIDNEIVENSNKYEKTIRILCQKCKSFQKNTNLITFNDFIKLKKTHKLKKNIKLFCFGDKKTYLNLKQFEVQYLPTAKKLLLTYLNPFYQNHQEEIIQIKFSSLSILGQMIKSKQKLNKIINSQSLKNIRKVESTNKFNKNKKKLKNFVLCSKNCPMSIQQKANYFFEQKEGLINLLLENSLQFIFSIVVLTIDQFQEFQEQIQWKSNQKCLSNIFFLITSQNSSLCSFYQTNKYYSSKQKVFQNLSYVLKRIEQKQLYETFSLLEILNQETKASQSNQKISRINNNSNIKKSNIVSSSKKYIFEQICKPTHLNIQILSKEHFLNNLYQSQIQNQENLYVILNNKQEESKYIQKNSVTIKTKSQIFKVYSQNMLEEFKVQVKDVLKIHREKYSQNIMTSTFLQDQKQKMTEQQNLKQIIVLCFNEDFQYVQQFICMHPNIYLIKLNSLTDLLSFRSIFPWFLVIPGQWSFLKTQNGIMIDYSTQKFERKLSIYINNFRNRFKKQYKTQANTQI